MVVLLRPVTNDPPPMDDPRFPHVRFPMFALDPPEQYPGMTSSHLATLLAVRSYAFTRSKGFGVCFASHQSIGKRSRQSVATVKRNIDALEQWSLLYRAGWRGKTRELVPIDHPDRFRAMREQQGLEAAKADIAAMLQTLSEKSMSRRTHLAHPRPTKNKRRVPDELPPLPNYIRFDNRAPRSSENPTEVISVKDQGHGRPTKNDLEEPFMKNTPQPKVGAALIERPSNNEDNGSATPALEIAPPPPTPPAETTEEAVARLRELMRQDKDFAKALS